ncbi:uncharacterized protein PV07_12498 [Cladophialophora immunda]|uniref:Major facilitator superfamily (MFS) profile domain-containing protein n=1 Tax=Cladophialophora immunda TaxID=569365 RepID=A0A0D1Z379_9EURO|nr:uncharacterized protein PV07_12498 [Cladophialophora immunda]KIW22081.1 hypothetical protein PV07_12498 [Cladophialophora immunda]
MLRWPSHPAAAPVDPLDILEPDLTLVRTKTPERWSQPRSNIPRVAATFWCFILLGANDSSYGVLIPHLESYYDISYLEVSLVLLAPAFGGFVSAFLNHSLHMYIGQRGIVIVVGFCQLAAYVTASFHPPFPVLVLVYILVGVSNMAKTGAWNAFVSSLQMPNELLGLLHGFYGIGATLAPLAGSSLMSQRDWKWYQFYYLFVGMALLDLVFSSVAFRHQSGAKYKEGMSIHVGANASHDVTVAQTMERIPSSSRPRLGRHVSSCISAGWQNCKKSQTGVCLSNKIVPLCSLYLLAYVGSEVALGGWLVTFMTKVRKGSQFASGVTPSGLWGGITVGRFFLGFITGRFFRNEKQATYVYLSLAVVMELLFWLVPNFLASAVFVSLLGFFLGPLFPATVVYLSKTLPSKIRVSAIGLCSAIGATGASVIPFMVGSVAQARGIGVLQPIVLAFLILCFVLWMSLPKVPKK